MKVLWLCNITLPDIAKKLNLKASNKEGWLSGILSAVKSNHDFDLAVAFPVVKNIGNVSTEVDGIKYYGFLEDLIHPEKYDTNLEAYLRQVVDDFNPDIVHCFGTEFPHCLAMCKIMSDRPEKILIGMQGVVGEIAKHYCDELPHKTVNRVSFRDIIKNDSIKNEKKKYELRAINEIEAIKLAGNVTGRTEFDRAYVASINPAIAYHHMDETLRNEFYEGEWQREKCRPHSIFFSQANYPIKGFHIMLEALRELKFKYADLKVFVAGDNITKHATIKEKIKISGYGKSLVEKIEEYELDDTIDFLGSVPTEVIKEFLLKCNVFVSTSVMENSSNSLGEAMLLGVPCVATDVGGTSSIFVNGQDGILCNIADNDSIIDAISSIFDSPELANQYSSQAKQHAEVTHNRVKNYNSLLEIYSHISNN